MRVRSGIGICDEPAVRAQRRTVAVRAGVRVGRSQEVQARGRLQSWLSARPASVSADRSFVAIRSRRALGRPDRASGRPRAGVRTAAPTRYRRHGACHVRRRFVAMASFGRSNPRKRWPASGDAAKRPGGSSATSDSATGPSHQRLGRTERSRSSFPWNRIDELDPSQRVLVWPRDLLILLNPSHSLVLGVSDADDFVESLQLSEPRLGAPDAVEEFV